MFEINRMTARTCSMLGQRGSIFGLAALDDAKEDDKFVLLTADLATLSGMDRYIKTYPNQFINVGIAEQNMLGISAGMAVEGYHPVVTTYATFVTMRSCEQIRHYLGYMKQSFELIKTAQSIVSYDNFEKIVVKNVASMFYVQQQYYSTCTDCNLNFREYVSRKKELFRKFIKSVMDSHSLSREVLYYANELGVSCGYMNEVCNEISHHSAKEIIDSAVAARLKYELLYTTKSVQELADEFNFPSQSYFSRYYKRLTGMTPTEFRKNR